MTVQTFNDSDRDFTAQLLKVRAAGADAIFCYGYETEQGIILRQRSELGMQDLRIFGERGCVLLRWKSWPDLKCRRRSNYH